MDKTSFLHEGVLFGVGIADHVSDLATGRQIAFQEGKSELQNYLPNTNLDHLTIETKDIYEEQSVDGSYRVYRLLMLPLVGVVEGESIEFERRARKLELDNLRAIETARLDLFKEQAEAAVRSYKQQSKVLKEAQEREARDKNWKQMEHQEWSKRFDIEMAIQWQVLDKLNADTQSLALDLPNPDMVHEAFEQHMRANRLASMDAHNRLRVEQWHQVREPAFAAKLHQEEKRYQKEQEYIAEQFARCIEASIALRAEPALSRLFCLEKAERDYEYVKRVGVKEALEADRRFQTLFEVADPAN